MLLIRKRNKLRRCSYKKKEYKSSNVGRGHWMYTDTLYYGYIHGYVKHNDEESFLIETEDGDFTFAEYHVVKILSRQEKIENVIKEE